MSKNHPLTLLLVDNQTKPSKSIHDKLQERGYRVIQPDRSVEAPEMVNNSPGLDLVIMDLLPDEPVTGIQLAEKILESPKVPLIFIASKQDTKTIEIINNTTPYGFVTPDVDPAQLDISITMALRLFEAHSSIIHEQKMRNDAFLQAKERRKELKALYRFSEIVEKEHVTRDEIYRHITLSLPESMQYPEWAWARIEIDDQTFQTDNFVETETKLSRPVQIDNTVIGKIEVGYTDHIFNSNNNPFLPEESLLIGALAERIGHISRQKKVKNALRKSEQKLIHSNKLMDYIIQHNRSAVAVHDRELNYIYVSQRYLDEYKVNEKEIIGRHHYDVFPDIPQKWRDVHQKALAGEVLSAEDDLFYREDGSVDWTRWECRPWYEMDGSIGGIIVYTEVITERKRNEEALRESRNFLKTVLDTIPTRVFWKDRDLNYLGCNHAFAVDLGVSTPDSIIGRNDQEIPWIPQADQYNKDDLEVITTGRSKLFFEEPQSTPDGREKTLRTCKVPLKNAKEEIIGVLGTYADITEEKRAERKIQQLNKDLENRVKERTAQLEASNKELEAFSYSVSHDLRAPLRHINGYVELLNNRFGDELPDKARHYLDTVTYSAKHMGTLIDELLQFSRTGRKELKISDVNMNALVREVLEMIEKETKDRNIKWEITPLPTVYGDHSLLKQVWINLLENAVKYTGKNPEASIEIGYHEKEEFKVFFVRDNGVGFDMKYANNLFGVFQRLHSSAEFEGTGIGLANVRRIVHKHHGRVWAEAQQNQGATLFFTLPHNPNPES